MIAVWLAAASLVLTADGGVASTAPDGGAAADAGRDGASADTTTPATAPVPIEAVTPRYPARARAAGREGTVVVRLEIDEAGAVVAASVGTSADADLDSAALEAARALRFTPAFARGKPIRAVIDWRVEFKLPRAPARAGASSAPADIPAPPAPTAPPAPPQGRLQGRVFAEGSRRSVAGAALTLGVTPVGETDATGRFAIDVPCGRRRLDVQAPRFAVLSIELDACADATPLVLRLSPQIGGPVYETVVRATPSQPQIRLEAEELTKTPGTLGDPFRAIESLPGVTTVQWPAPIYVVRGSNPGNTGFFLDDVRVPALFHLALGPSVIHPYFFENLELYTGSYPARFGRYVAGIVSAETRAPPGDGVHSSVDVRLFDAGALLSTPFPDGRGTVAAAARYSYTGALISALNESVALSYWDYQVRADRNVGPRRLRLLLFGSSDRLAPDRAAPDASARELVVGFHRANLQAALPIGGGRIIGSVSLGSDHTKAPFVSGVPITVDATSVAPRLTYRRTSVRADLEAGFDGELDHYTPVIAIDRPQALDLARRRDARTLAGYVSLTVRAGTRLQLTPEVRYDSYAVGGVQQADLGPRLSGRLALTGDTWLKVAGGRFSQMPSVPLQIPGVENFGLALYGLQTSWQGSAGIGSTHFGGLDVELPGYVQRYVLSDVRNVTISMIDPLADDLLIRRDALSYGAELLIRRPLTERLHGWLSYTLSTSLRALGNGVVGPSDWDQRHVANLVLGYRIGRYTLGGRAHVNTGRPYPLAATAAGYNRLPTYEQLDLRCDRRYVFKAFSFELYAELQNATLSRQVISLNYYPTSVGTAGIHETSYRIVLPSVGIHGEM